MKRIHVIGGKNHGKTTLVCALVDELSRRSFRVGTIKHTHHNHELDTPGKDSQKHRLAGAATVGILTHSMHAVFWPVESVGKADDPRDSDSRYDRLLRVFDECDLVLVEGDTQTSALKLEVWRAAVGTVPLAEQGVEVLAIVSDDVIATPLPVIPRNDIFAIADFVLDSLEMRHSNRL